MDLKIAWFLPHQWLKYALFAFRVYLNRKLHLYRYKQIGRKLPSHKFGFFGANSTYGHNRAIKNYLKANQLGEKIDGVIEHGLYFGNIYLEKEIIETQGKYVYTYSEFRRKVLEPVTDKQVRVVGPYIKYAEALLSPAEEQQLKAENGKTLLVMPAHGLRKMEPSFDIDCLIEETEKVKSQFEFDTVLVCLYWMDIKRGYDKKYIEKGYQVVTAGHWKDPYFLSRLKSIINISDLLMSNSIGTYVGYAVCLDTPVYIFGQEVKYVGNYAEQTKSHRGDNWQGSSQEMKSEIASHFSTTALGVSEEQRAIIKRYWGEF